MTIPEPEYVQLSSWEELVSWLEREAAKIGGPLAPSRPPPPAQRPRNKRRATPGQESLFG